MTATHEIEADGVTRIGVIGAGVMGSFHAATISELSMTELAFVADPRPDVASACARKLGCPGSEDVGAALEAEGTAAVVIATPVGTHLDLIEQAASAGLHIFCEKPLAPTVHECARAIAVAETHQVKLQVGFHRRFDPDWRRLRDAYVNGEIGELLMLKSTLRDLTAPPPEYIKTSGGYFADAFVHDFDAARWIGGEVDRVTAVGLSATAEFQRLGDFDNAIVVLEFATGGVAVLDGSRVGGYGYDCHAELVGSSVTLRLDNPPASHLRRLAAGESAERFPLSFLDRFGPAYRAELRAFAQLVSADQQPEVSGVDALTALAIADAARLAADQRRTVRLEEVLGLGATGSSSGSSRAPASTLASPDQ